MSGLQTYALASIYVNSRLLAEAASVKISRKTNAQPANTLSKGYAGQSPGAKMLEITIESLVPATDFEFDPGDAMDGNIPLEFTCFAAGRTLTTKGFVNEDDFSQAVNSEAKQSLTASCEFAKWR